MRNWNTGPRTSSYPTFINGSEWTLEPYQVHSADVCCMFQFLMKTCQYIVSFALLMFKCINPGDSHFGIVIPLHNFSFFTFTLTQVLQQTLQLTISHFHFPVLCRLQVFKVVYILYKLYVSIFMVEFNVEVLTR